MEPPCRAVRRSVSVSLSQHVNPHEASPQGSHCSQGSLGPTGLTQDFAETVLDSQMTGFGSCEGSQHEMDSRASSQPPQRRVAKRPSRELLLPRTLSRTSSRHAAASVIAMDLSGNLSSTTACTLPPRRPCPKEEEEGESTSQGDIKRRRRSPTPQTPTPTTPPPRAIFFSSTPAPAASSMTAAPSHQPQGPVCSQTGPLADRCWSPCSSFTSSSASPPRLVPPATTSAAVFPGGTASSTSTSVAETPNVSRGRRTLVGSKSTTKDVRKRQLTRQLTLTDSFRRSFRAAPKSWSRNSVGQQAPIDLEADSEMCMMEKIWHY
mmetsp:Transcript_118814/g.236700  ORF Transcript_118814/g.236700 Transcript_118814/m.236700 type:complete len:321 (-) Transcript_118814:883-1845(-)